MTVRIEIARSYGVEPVTCTRAELDESCVFWRWLMWCREWSVVGAFAVGIDRRERELFR